MRFNPFLDPSVEAGYLGYALRCVAHRTRERRFQPSIEVRDHRCGNGVLLYECSFDQLFSDPDVAIRRGMRVGRQFVDEIIATKYAEHEIFV